MTRRDTIISAALINAGLLVVLFVCALGIDDGVQANSHSSEMTPAVHASSQTQAPVAPAQNLLVPEAQIQEIALEETSAKTQHQTNRSWTTIEVQKGDRIDKIASRYQMSVEELLHANDLQTTQLVVGQALKVLAPNSAQASITSDLSQELLSTPTTPAPTSQKVAAKNTATKAPVKKEVSKEPSRVVSQKPAPTQELKPVAVSKQTVKPIENGAQYHYVQNGESPWVIAKKYGLTVESLLKLNGLDEKTARRLKVGDRLRVR